MNTCTFVGRLVAAVELVTFEGGAILGTFSLAVDDYYRKAKCEELGTEYKPDFIDFKVWGKQATTLAQYAIKGQQLIVEASARQERWTDEVTKTNRSRIVFVVKSFTFGQKPLSAMAKDKGYADETDAAIYGDSSDKTIESEVEAEIEAEIEAEVKVKLAPEIEAEIEAEVEVKPKSKSKSKAKAKTTNEVMSLF